AHSVYAPSSAWREHPRSSRGRLSPPETVWDWHGVSEGTGGSFMTLIRFAIGQASVLCIALALNTASSAAETDDDPPLDFLVGDYVVIGRDPDGGATYSGSARIQQTGNELLLSRTRSERKVIAGGRLEVPSPPAAGHI